MNSLSTFTNRPRLLTAAIFGTLALGFAAVSVAADTSDAPHIAVSYGDLDISTSPGAATLYNRIDTAAHRVCKSYDLDTDLLQIRAYYLRRACIREAIARAVSQVGVGQLIAIYKARSHWHR